MIFKKLLISLISLGVIGGTGAGVYYLKNKDNSETTTQNSSLEVPSTGDAASANPSPSAKPEGEERDTSIVNSVVATPPPSQPEQP